MRRKLQRADIAPPAAPPTADRLPRLLGVWSVTAVVIGSMIGSGIYRVPSTVAANAGGEWPMISAWLAGGAVALSGALSLAELAALFPRAGGLYAFLYEAYGPLPAFLFGWLLLIINPAQQAAVALVFAEYLGRLVTLTPLQVQLVAVAVIVLTAAANYRSVRGGALIVGVFSSAKVLALGAIIVGAFVLRPLAVGASPREVAVAGASWSGFGLALVAVLWAYDGWQDGTLVAGEVRDPGRSLPRGLIGGTLLVAVVYLAANAAYLHVLPFGVIAGSPLVAADVASRLVGGAGTALIAGLVCLSTFGTVNTGFLTFPRVFFAMAEDRLFFRAVAAVHPRNATPHVAVTVIAGLSIVYLTLGTFERLIETVILGYLPFWALAVGAVVVLRHKHPELQRPYRTPGYPLTPLVFAVATLGILANSLWEHPGAAGVTLGAILAGIPIYFGWLRAQRTHGT